VRATVPPNPALAPLALALAALEAAGRPRVPCQRPTGPEGNVWLSDDPEARKTAATACQWCPVLDACRAAGAGETFGVWGGIDRRPRARPGDDDNPDKRLKRHGVANLEGMTR